MTDRNFIMRIRNEQGIALVLSLFLMMALSAIAVSLMFLSQTETYSSLNYRLMSQTRYGAESGIQMTVNYLLNNYKAPATAGANPADLLANYDTAKSPVICLAGCPNNGQPVVLSGNGAVASNYPVAAVQAAFSAAVQGTLPAGTTTVTYAPSATLLSMQQVNTYGGGTTTIQTWQITSDGSIAVLGRTAQVEVTALLERQKAPAQMYAAFATSGGCGALQFAGGATVNSYDSAALVGGAPAIQHSGGNVGTNGNLNESGGATIEGSLSTPRVGVGNCSNGNVDALTSKAGATVLGGVVQLPQAVTLPTPVAPNPLPPTTNVTITSNTTYAPGSYGNINVSGNGQLHLSAGTYNLNRLTMQDTSRLVIDSGPVILNIAGQGETDDNNNNNDNNDNNDDDNAVLTFSSQAMVVNTSYDPSKLQIQYAGTKSIKLTGGSSFAAMVYAPNAAASFSGGSDFYGSVVAATVKDTGGAKIHYDSHLSKAFFTAGNPMMTSFSWKKY